VTLKAVATALDIPLKSGSVAAEGDLDFCGTLGVAKDAPVGFAQIRRRFDLDTDAPQEKLDQLLKLTERYCVVCQTIRNGPGETDGLTLRRSRSGSCGRDVSRTRVLVPPRAQDGADGDRRRRHLVGGRA
jgi:OsmC-like protein